MKVTRNKLFNIFVFITFLAVMIYEFLTPIMSDDIVYGDAVREAGNFFDLFSQEYEHYMGHTGRSVAHMILRIFLFTGTKAVYNVFAAGAFTILSLLIYKNIDGKKEFDIRAYLMVVLMLWLLDPAISNTVFWMSGACNYLFTTTLIMGFMTIYRFGVREKRENSIPLMIGMLLYGILCGWCNENTSGGLILFILIILFVNYRANGKSFGFVKPWMVTGLVGSVLGFVMLLLSPGNYGRMDTLEENHTGLVGMAARFLKITLNIKNNYLLLVLVAITGMILIGYLSKEDVWDKISSVILYTVLFFATCYALIMVPSSELRSYYGASIFLMVAAGQVIITLVSFFEDKELLSRLVQGLFTAAVVAGMIFLFLTYMEEGANLGRIKREFDERDNYLQQMADAGEVDVIAPKLRPDWDNRFSMAYRSDIEEDYHFWINTFYSNHYKLDTVSGVDREEFTAY